MICRDPSLLPSSIRIARQSRRVCASTLSSAIERTDAPFKTGTTNVTGADMHPSSAVSGNLNLDRLSGPVAPLRNGLDQEHDAEEAGGDRQSATPQRSKRRGRGHRACQVALERKHAFGRLQAHNGVAGARQQLPPCRSREEAEVSPIED